MVSLKGKPLKDDRYSRVLFPALGCILLDQLTKLAVVALLPFNASVPVVAGLLNLVHVHNRGAAFGFLNRPDTQWQFWLFFLATLVTVGLIVWMTRSSRYNRALYTGFGLILGGALGNLLDRLRLRAVIDFMDFYLGSWHWPAFNVADVAICLGAVLAALALWRLAEAEKRDNHVPD